MSINKSGYPFSRRPIKSNEPATARNIAFLRNASRKYAPKPGSLRLNSRDRKSLVQRRHKESIEQRVETSDINAYTRHDDGIAYAKLIREGPDSTCAVTSPQNHPLCRWQTTLQLGKNPDTEFKILLLNKATDASNNGITNADAELSTQGSIRAIVICVIAEYDSIFHYSKWLASKQVSTSFIRARHPISCIPLTPRNQWSISNTMESVIR